VWAACTCVRDGHARTRAYVQPTLHLPQLVAQRTCGQDGSWLGGAWGSIGGTCVPQPCSLLGILGNPLYKLVAIPIIDLFGGGKGGDLLDQLAFGAPGAVLSSLNESCAMWPILQGTMCGIACVEGTVPIGGAAPRESFEITATSSSSGGSSGTVASFGQAIRCLEGGRWSPDVLLRCGAPTCDAITSRGGGGGVGSELYVPKQGAGGGVRCAHGRGDNVFVEVLRWLYAAGDREGWRRKFPTFQYGCCGASCVW